MGNFSILLVEDRVTIIENIKGFFSENETRPTLYSATNTIDAWSMLEGFSKLNPIPKILLIDVNRTKEEGILLLNTIRNHPDLKSILVFVITDAAQETNKAAVLKLNIAGYIPTSFQRQELYYCFSVLNDYWNMIEF